MSIRYPVYRPHLGDLEKQYVADCLETTWISSKGAYIEKFEAAFAEFTGVGYALSVSNGTVALHVALEALGIGPGDEVIVPSLTYIASANAVRYTGATPVFADSEPGYWQLDLAAAERKITERTRAIMPVHLYGQACDMDAVTTLARKYGLLVVEDCAEALGTRWKGRHVGTFGDVSTFSFFGNKTITTGEGGMVVTNDAGHADIIMRLKGQGLAKNREYFHDMVGYNYRMTNICAAIGLAQMSKLPFILERKSDIAKWYAEALESLPVAVHRSAPDSLHSYWIVSILADDPADRDPLRAALRSAGIETRPLFVPIHQMPMYRESDDDYPVASALSVRGLNLPSYPDLEKSDVFEIAGVVRDFFSNTAEGVRG